MARRDAQKIKTKKRKTIYRDIWNIFKVLLTIALLAVLRYGIELPQFGFGVVEVRPKLFDLSKSDVLLVGELKEPVNLLTVDKFALEKRLLQDLRINKARVYYSFPNRLVINIEENKPLVYLKTPYAFLEIDANYTIVKIVKSISNPEIPILNGVYEEQSFVGDKIKSPVAINVIDFLKKIPWETKGIISEIMVDKNNARIITLNKTRVIVGNVNEIATKAEVFETVLNHVREQNLAVEYIDLSYERPFIKVNKENLAKK